LIEIPTPWTASAFNAIQALPGNFCPKFERSAFSLGDSVARITAMDQRLLHISDEEIRPTPEGRFHRFGLIEWWDQTKLAAAKVLVVGAGALGNEIVKNLALLGVGNLLVADQDRVENSNLSRSVLYRAGDNGKPKAVCAVNAAQDIYPDIKAHAFVGNVVYDLGGGAFHWADVVIGGLDNREARLAINRHCLRAGRPYIDGAIEAIAGTARVFLPREGPCYECTMSASDWKLLQRRRSCNLLSRPDMESGKTPTTPTIASIIAGVQCQEAIKVLHGLPTIGGKGWIFSGISGDSYLVDYQRKADCLSHETLDEIVPLEAGANDLSVSELVREARRRLPGCTVELTREVLRSLDCPNCGAVEQRFESLGKAPASLAECPNCPGISREVKTFFRLSDDASLQDLTLAEIGVPPFDIIIARSGARVIGLELSADRGAVLGSLAAEAEALSWE
jgi:molybdopterin/thiamine biosynthesis adenylyltransferase